MIFRNVHIRKFYFNLRDFIQIIKLNVFDLYQNPEINKDKNLYFQTTTAIDPRLLRTIECDEEDAVSWKTITDEKSVVSLAHSQHGSMNNLVLDCNENATIVKIRSKLINLLDIVNQVHPMTDSMEFVRNQIGTTINDLIDNTDSPTSTVTTLAAPPIKHSKLLSTTDSHELIPIRKPLNNSEQIETPTFRPRAEKFDITTTNVSAVAEHMIDVKNSQLSSNEYFESKKSFPVYMRPQRNTSASLFNCTPTTETEWNKLVQTLQGNGNKDVTQEIFNIASGDQNGETNEPGRSRSITISETLKNSRPNPILRKTEKTKVTIRSLLHLLERGDDDVDEQFFGEIPKSE